MLEIVIGFWLAAAPVGSAQAMTVAEFLPKAEALQRKGPMALLSPDYSRLKAEFGAGMTALGVEGRASMKAGHPIICPPKKAQITETEFMQYLRTIAPARRDMNVKAAVFELAKKKFACPA